MNVSLTYMLIIIASSLSLAVYSTHKMLGNKSERDGIIYGLIAFAALFLWFSSTLIVFQAHTNPGTTNLF